MPFLFESDSDNDDDDDDEACNVRRRFMIIDNFGYSLLGRTFYDTQNAYSGKSSISRSCQVPPAILL